MKPVYAVFDTNVLVSALMSMRQDSPTVRLLDHVVDECIVLIYNDDILREYDEVLHRKKFRFLEENIQAVLELVKTGLFLDPANSSEIFPDPDDRVFYEVALAKGRFLYGNRKPEAFSHQPHRRDSSEDDTDYDGRSVDHTPPSPRRNKIASKREQTKLA